MAITELVLINGSLARLYYRNNVRVQDGEGKQSAKEGFCFEVSVTWTVPSHRWGTCEH